MKTPRQLVSTTLYDLGKTVMDYQMALSLIALDAQALSDEQRALEAERSRIKALLAAAQHKIDWEFRTNHNLLGLTPVNDEDDDGEAWKDGVPVPPTQS